MRHSRLINVPPTTYTRLHVRDEFTFGRDQMPLPIGRLEKCDGCDQTSVGFFWETEVETDEGKLASVDKQMCFECLWDCMMINRVRRAQQLRQLNDASLSVEEKILSKQ